MIFTMISFSLKTPMHLRKSTINLNVITYSTFLVFKSRSSTLKTPKTRLIRLPPQSQAKLELSKRTRTYSCRKSSKLTVLSISTRNTHLVVEFLTKTLCCIRLSRLERSSKKESTSMTVWTRSRKRSVKSKSKTPLRSQSSSSMNWKQMRLNLSSKSMC